MLAEPAAEADWWAVELAVASVAVSVVVGAEELAEAGVEVEVGPGVLEWVAVEEVGWQAPEIYLFASAGSHVAVGLAVGLVGAAVSSIAAAEQHAGPSCVVGAGTAAAAGPSAVVGESCAAFAAWAYSWPSSAVVEKHSCRDPCSVGSSCYGRVGHSAGPASWLSV